jgi:hypothetical protein
VLLKVSEDEERLHVVGLVAPDGEVVIAHVSATVPVNELPGVTVMVDVLPLAAPGLTVRLVGLLERVKLVLLLPFGACQKSPQPAKSGAATSINFAHLPIFISTPSMPASKPSLQGIAWMRVLSCCPVRRTRAISSL